MTERLIIQNFAGLNLDVELGRVNIFIGPQASGKSVCAKCLYFFKSFTNELISLSSASKNKAQFDKDFLDKFKSYFSNIWRSKSQFALRYEIGSAYIELIGKDNKIKLVYSSTFQEAAIKIRAVYRQVEDDINTVSHPRAGRLSLAWSIDVMRYADEIRNQLTSELGYAAFSYQSFILAGRSFFSALKGAVLTFLSSTDLADPFLRDFISTYERDRKLYHEIDFPKEIVKLVSIILKGEVEMGHEEDYIVASDGRKVLLAYSSSGQQEAFPLLLILLSFLWRSDFVDEAPVLQTVYIEEPEAHLFSESQRAMAQLMAAVYIRSSFPLQLVVTTHSPYLLASFNNLIYAHQLAETLREQPAALKKLNAIVPKSQQLPLPDFRVYGFENGGVRSLIDHETGLISADLLDSASDVISNQFGELMDLDPSTKG